MNIKYNICVFTVTLLLCVGVSARTIAFDPFDYPVGDRLGVSNAGGIGWSPTHPGFYGAPIFRVTESDAEVIEGSLEHPAATGDFTPSGNSILLQDAVQVVRPFDSWHNLENSDQAIYFSFLIRMDEPNRVFLHLGEDRVFHSFYVGIDTNMRLRGYVFGGPIRHGLQTLRTGRTYLIVGKVTSDGPGANSVHFSSFTDLPAGEPEFWDVSTSSTENGDRFGAISGFRLQSTEESLAVVDEVSFGTTWEAVVPQP